MLGSPYSSSTVSCRIVLYRIGEWNGMESINQSTQFLSISFAAENYNRYDVDAWTAVQYCISMVENQCIEQAHKSSITVGTDYAYLYLRSNRSFMREKLLLSNLRFTCSLHGQHLLARISTCTLVQLHTTCPHSTLVYLYVIGLCMNVSRMNESNL